MTANGLPARSRGKHTVALGVVGALPIAGLIAACGGSASTATGATANARATKASPSPGPTPALIVVEVASQGQKMLEALTPSGSPVWSATNPGSASVAGSYVFATAGPGEELTVLNRSGGVVGHATAPPYLQGGQFSPTSTEWAWRAYDSNSVVSPTTEKVTNSFWVSGLGETAHRVYTISETVPTTACFGLVDPLFMWSDAGLISTPIDNSGCAGPQETTTYAIDPVSGARRDLATDGRETLDVHDGLIVARDASDAETVLISGRTSFQWTNAPAVAGETLLAGSINPGGTRVMITLYTPASGSSPSTARVVFIDVATHAVSVVPGYQALTWVDDSHVVADVSGASADPKNPELDIVGVDGSHRFLATGVSAGVLLASA